MKYTYQSIAVVDGRLEPLAHRLSRAEARRDGWRVLASLALRRQWDRAELAKWANGFEVVRYGR